MKNKIILISTALIFISGAIFALKIPVRPAPNGIEFPSDYRNWRIIAPSHRTDNNTIRVVLGNDIAIQAARFGDTNPWPDGSIMAKLVWKDRKHDKWSEATIPGEFVHAEFMVKDSKKYSDTGGWGFARWMGLTRQPYGKDADFVQECFGCHQPVKDNDYVFTHPAELP